MIDFFRPEEPASWTNNAKRQEARNTIENIVKEERRAPHSNEFEALWGSCKPHFIEAQQRKCGYCESFVTSVDVGAIEHYRPKAAIKVLSSDPDGWGYELEDSGNLRSRKTTVVSEYGYWWLAYEWSNYLFSCNNCNKWKGNLFPLVGLDTRNLSLNEGEEVNEVPLLLNPFVDQQPWLRFSFTDLGSIGPANDDLLGLETIKTCGLAREGLRASREYRAKRTFGLVNKIRSALATEEDIDTCLEELYELGHSRQEYAGMVRSIIRQELDIPWSQLSEYYSP